MSKNTEYNISRVQIGATAAEGGSRSGTFTIGGASALPFSGDGGRTTRLIALEICDNPEFWSPVVLEATGDVTSDPGAWAQYAIETAGADLVRLYFTSTKERGFEDVSGIRKTTEELLQATAAPLILEGSNEPAIDSEVFAACAEAAEGERLLIGTAEADRYRSLAAASLAYGHAIIAQSPIDINLAKQLNIMLRETGVPADRIVIDPYTGALGYGFEYSYSVMERIRLAAFKGDTDLAMPMISSAIDSLNVKEVREADPAVKEETAVAWEYYAGLSAFIAGAEVVCVRHPATVLRLRSALRSLEGV